MLYHNDKVVEKDGDNNTTDAMEKYAQVHYIYNKQKAIFNKLGQNQKYEIFLFLDLFESFKLAMVNKWAFKAYYNYCQSLPTLLKDLSKNVRDGKLSGEDRSYPF